MRASALLLVLLAAWPACADTEPTMLRGRMPSLDQRRIGAATFAPAPVPNPDMAARSGPRNPTTVEVSPTLTQPNNGRALTGDGFARGSAYNGDLERRGRGGLGATMVPSLNLRVPMQVDFH
ncbi:MAG: hypothetical protein IT555_04245 [Acetobacteraceae bacterium]|nr:hypothetical protein [Acetobacteraceae bacterium]